jgi:uncharacterized protein YqjF (DUF2071 family)
VRIDREVMHMWWEDLTFVHYEVDPQRVQRLLPKGLTVDTFEGRTWVGLIPFAMRVGAPGAVQLPVVGAFCETNVRTYVVGPDGRQGVWFHSLEASGATATFTARATYGLPYFWARMSIEHSGTTVAYESTRRIPGPKGAHHRSVARIGERIEQHDVSPLEHFLTARWGLYSVWRGHLVHAAVEHPPWLLHRARLLELEDDLLRVAELEPDPGAEPLVHWTPGTSIRIGRPTFAP